jgi:peptidyl-tRNA hydrolase, PTH1 family
MAFRRKPQKPVSRVIVGLGNPGRDYAGTRHNVGFMTIDLLAKRMGVKADRKEMRSHVAEARHPADPSTLVLLVKPQTWMNLSGEAVARVLGKHKLGPGDMWLVYDELDLPFGRLRLRKSGGAGGHNGVKSVIDAVGSDRFARFRVGIGHPDDEPDPIDHLLSPFTPEERDRLPALLELAADAVSAALTEGIDIAMNRYNGQAA